MYKIQVKYPRTVDPKPGYVSTWRVFTAHYKIPEHAQEWVEHIIKVIESERGNLWPITIYVNGNRVERPDDVALFMED